MKCYESENKIISSSFETDLTEWQNAGGGGERYQESDIEISTDYAKTGNASCKFTVSSESYVAGGVRAELTFEHGATSGEENWFEYSFLIPDSYSDVLINASDGSPNWQLIGQWHQQPVFCKGDDWDNFKGNGESPPIGLYYNYLSSSDPEYSTIMNDESKTSTYGFDKTWDNVSVISLVYGEQSIAIKKIEKGTWYTVKFHIGWSCKKDGFIESWINDESFTNGKIEGPNMLNKASHYFKFGLYRNPSITSTNSIYYDDVKVW